MGVLSTRQQCVAKYILGRGKEKKKEKIPIPAVRIRSLSSPLRFKPITRPGNWYVN